MMREPERRYMGQTTFAHDPSRVGRRSLIRRLIRWRDSAASGDPSASFGIYTILHDPT